MSYYPSSKRRYSYKVLEVTDLHPKANDEVARVALRQYFRKFGDISVRVVKEPEGRTAFVYFKTCAEAHEAYLAKSGFILYDRHATVKPVIESFPQEKDSDSTEQAGPHGQSYLNNNQQYRSATSFPNYRGVSSRGYRGRGGPKRFNLNPYQLNLPHDEALASRTLFVGNLSGDITEGELYKLFSKFGTVVQIVVKSPNLPGNCAYAFVSFSNVDIGYRAKKELSRKPVGDPPFKIGFGKTAISPKIHVGGLGPWCSNYQLWSEFDRFGVIKSLNYNPGCSSAQILYSTPDGAEAAVKTMRGYPLGGSDKRIRVDFIDLDTPLMDDEEISSPPTPEDPEPCGPQSLEDVCDKGPIVWTGGFTLKKLFYPTQLHLVQGSSQILDYLKDQSGRYNLLIKQRLKMEQTRLDEISAKLNSNPALLSISVGVPGPAPGPHVPNVKNLKNFIDYLKIKNSAAVVAFTYRLEESSSDLILYCFPPCKFAYDILRENASCNLTTELTNEFLLVVIV